ncbi:MAG: universal stress protein [Flavobacteriales bacterium]
MAQILIPTDMSDGSRKAVLFAVDAFGIELSEFILLLSVGDVPRPTMVPEFIQYVKQEAHEELKRFIAEIQESYPGKTLNIRGVVENGSVISVVEQYTQENPVDMVVMGTRGAGGALRWGSNAEVVSRNFRGPLIVVPPEWKPGPIEKILYADDRQEVRDGKTLLPLVQLAKRYDAGIEFVHVSDEVKIRPTDTGVASHAPIFEGIKCTTASMVDEDVTKALSYLVDSGEYGILAVLHRRLGWLDALLHRSVAKRMALNTTVPLLVMHE